VAPLPAHARHQQIDDVATHRQLPRLLAGWTATVALELAGDERARGPMLPSSMATAINSITGAAWGRLRLACAPVAVSQGQP
jgi:hypothetical protein